MEPPTKRRRLSSPPAYDDDLEDFIDDGDDMEMDELSIHPSEVSPRRDADHLLSVKRAHIGLKFQSTMEEIFAKYSHDFEGVGDEIDLMTGEIIVNNGHIRNLRKIKLLDQAPIRSYGDVGEEELMANMGEEGDGDRLLDRHRQTWSSPIRRPNAGPGRAKRYSASPHASPRIPDGLDLPPNSVNIYAPHYSFGPSATPYGGWRSADASAGQPMSSPGYTSATWFRSSWAKRTDPWLRASRLTSQPVKRKVGRPRKYPPKTQDGSKRKVGRPRKLDTGPPGTAPEASNYHEDVSTPSSDIRAHRFRDDGSVDGASDGDHFLSSSDQSFTGSLSQYYGDSGPREFSTTKRSSRRARKPVDYMGKVPWNDALRTFSTAESPSMDVETLEESQWLAIDLAERARQDFLSTSDDELADSGTAEHPAVPVQPASRTFVQDSQDTATPPVSSNPSQPQRKPNLEWVRGYNQADYDAALVLSDEEAPVLFTSRKSMPISRGLRDSNAATSQNVSSVHMTTPHQVRGEVDVGKRRRGCPRKSENQSIVEPEGYANPDDLISLCEDIVGEGVHTDSPQSPKPRGQEVKDSQDTNDGSVDLSSAQPAPTEAQTEPNVQGRPTKTMHEPVSDPQKRRKRGRPKKAQAEPVEPVKREPKKRGRSRLIDPPPDEAEPEQIATSSAEDQDEEGDSHSEHDSDESEHLEPSHAEDVDDTLELPELENADQETLPQSESEASPAQRNEPSQLDDQDQQNEDTHQDDAPPLSLGKQPDLGGSSLPSPAPSNSKPLPPNKAPKDPSIAPPPKEATSSPAQSSKPHTPRQTRLLSRRSVLTLLSGRRSSGVAPAAAAAAADEDDVDELTLGDISVTPPAHSSGGAAHAVAKRRIWKSSALTKEVAPSRTPVRRRGAAAVGSPGSTVRTPGGTVRTCGVDGFRCDRDFCFTCL